MGRSYDISTALQNAPAGDRSIASAEPIETNRSARHLEPSKAIGHAL
jgi:hypothetical protein